MFYTHYIRKGERGKIRDSDRGIVRVRTCTYCVLPNQTIAATYTISQKGLALSNNIAIIRDGRWWVCELVFRLTEVCPRIFLPHW